VGYEVRDEEGTWRSATGIPRQGDIIRSVRPAAAQ
jgi:hypothetical protein